MRLTGSPSPRPHLNRPASDGLVCPPCRFGVGSSYHDAAAKVLAAADYYAIFDLNRLEANVPKAPLKKVFRELSKLTHPDKSQSRNAEDASGSLRWSMLC